MSRLNPGAHKAALSDEENVSGTGYPLRLDMVISQLNALSNVQINIQLHIEDKRQFDYIKSDKGDVPGVSDLDAALRIEPPHSQEITLSIPLSQLEDFSGSVSLPIDYGVPSQYPEDWYDASAWIFIELPEGWGYFSGSGGAGPGSTVPVNLALYSERNTGIMGYYDVDQKDTGAMSVAELRLAPTLRLRLWVQRDSLTRGFIWTMAATPLLLVLLTAITPLSRSQQSNPVSLEAVALLAILPLRQVLVPPEIRGLTPVDFFLGAELAAFIMLILARYGISLRKREQ